MSKNQYIFPQVEVETVIGACNIMKTSIDLLPDPSAAPKRDRPF